MEWPPAPCRAQPRHPPSHARVAAAPRYPRGVFLIVPCAAAGFGAIALLTQGAYTGRADLFGVLIARFWVAALVLLAVARYRRLPRPPRPPRVTLCAMGGIGYTGMSARCFAAPGYAPTSLVALLQSSDAASPEAAPSSAQV